MMVPVFPLLDQLRCHPCPAYSRGVAFGCRIAGFHLEDLPLKDPCPLKGSKSCKPHRETIRQSLLFWPTHSLVGNVLWPWGWDQSRHKRTKQTKAMVNQPLTKTTQLSVNCSSSRSPENFMDALSILPHGTTFMDCDEAGGASCQTSGATNMHHSLRFVLWPRSVLWLYSGHFLRYRYRFISLTWSTTHTEVSLEFLERSLKWKHPGKSEENFTLEGHVFSSYQSNTHTGRPTWTFEVFHVKLELMLLNQLCIVPAFFLSRQRATPPTGCPAEKSCSLVLGKT